VGAKDRFLEYYAYALGADPKSVISEKSDITGIAYPLMDWKAAPTIVATMLQAEQEDPGHDRRRYNLRYHSTKYSRNSFSINILHGEGIEPPNCPNAF